MGAGSSSASTKAPGHHVAIAGLTGITHGTTRHVTWAFYHETGYYTVYVQHDGLSGRRAIQSNGRELAAQRFNLNLLDSSSSHHFVLATNQLLDSAAAKALDEQITTRRAAAEKNKKMLEPISKKPEDATVVVRIVEENVRFVYSLIIDGLSYRLYQRWFWTHAYIWKFPRVALTRKRRQRPPEEGIRDEEHSCVYIVGTTPVMLLDGEPISMQSGFCEGEGTQHTFDAEPDVPVVLWIVPKKPSEVAAAIAAANAASASAASSSSSSSSSSATVDGHDHAFFGIQDPSSRGHARLTFDYKLKVGSGAWLEPIAQPPLLSPQWQARGDQAVRKLPEEKPVNPPTEAAVAATTSTTASASASASADAVTEKVAEMKVGEPAAASS